MKNVRPLVLASLFCFAFLSACSTATNSNANSANINAKPTASPTPSEEEQKRASDERDAVRKKALDDFVNKNYPGWKTEGSAVELSIDCEYEPCDLHLVKGKQSKVVSVLVRQFHRADGTTYWLAFEARFIDLALAKIRDIKESEKETTREYVLQNLEWDDCQAVFDAERDAHDDRGDYDPN